MITWWQIYLFTRLDYLPNIFYFLCISAGITLTCSLVGYFVSTSESKSAYHKAEIKSGYLDWSNKFYKICKISVLFLFLSVALLNAVPSQKEMAAIYLIPKIVNNEKVIDTSTKLYDVLTTKLDEWLRDNSLIKEEKKSL